MFPEIRKAGGISSFGFSAVEDARARLPPAATAGLPYRRSVRARARRFQPPSTTVNRFLHSVPEDGGKKPRFRLVDGRHHPN